MWYCLAPADVALFECQEHAGPRRSLGAALEAYELDAQLDRNQACLVLLALPPAHGGYSALLALADGIDRQASAFWQGRGWGA